MSTEIRLKSLPFAQHIKHLVYECHTQRPGLRATCAQWREWLLDHLDRSNPDYLDCVIGEAAYSLRRKYGPKDPDSLSPQEVIKVGDVRLDRLITGLNEEQDPYSVFAPNATLRECLDDQRIKKLNIDRARAKYNRTAEVLDLLITAVDGNLDATVEQAVGALGK